MPSTRTVVLDPTIIDDNVTLALVFGARVSDRGEARVLLVDDEATGQHAYLGDDQAQLVGAAFDAVDPVGDGGFGNLLRLLLSNEDLDWFREVFDLIDSGQAPDSHTVAGRLVAGAVAVLTAEGFPEAIADRMIVQFARRTRAEVLS